MGHGETRELWDCEWTLNRKQPLQTGSIAKPGCAELSERTVMEKGWLRETVTSQNPEGERTL